jgi:cobalt-zinc-cadmium efflux system protein
LITPPKVESNILISVGIIAFLVNLATAWLVKSGSEHDLNLRSAFLHLMGDVVSTIGAVIAGVVIAFTGLNWLDPAVSVLIGILILVSGWVILREAIDILLESTPNDIDVTIVTSNLMQVKGVKGVHDVHIWSITQGIRLLSAHILTEDISISAGALIQREVNEILREQYKITHATLQLECLGCEPDALFCDMKEAKESENHHDHSK